MKAKSKTLLVILLAALLMPGLGHAAGTVEDITVYCPAVEADRGMKVYLPEGYDELSRQYPVVYYLHGYGYNYQILWSFFNIKAQLDNLITSGAIEPIIFVSPDGYEDRYDGAWYSDSELYGNFETYIATDIVDYVDDNYRTVPEREFRHVVGHSMGGYGAMRAAFNRPGVFAGASSMAGVLILLESYIEEHVSRVVSEAGSGPPYDFNPDNGPSTVMLFSKSGAWSPNMDNPPYYVDLPCDEYGVLIDEVVARWADNDLTQFAREYVARGDAETYPLHLWLGAGTGDPQKIAQAEAFSDSLDMLGLVHELVEYPGDHFVVPLNETLPPIVVGVGNSENEHAEWPRLGTPQLVGPGLVRLTYELPTDGVASLAVYDVAGRHIATLMDGRHSQGEHTIQWNTRDAGRNAVATGVYFFRLDQGGMHVSEKLVLVE